jgi:guanylate kinase
LNNQVIEESIPAVAAGPEVREPTIFIVSAPSGSGKSTLVSRLLASDLNLSFSVSYTTRQPRGTEKQGHSYVYVSRDQFLQLLSRDEFLEHAEVFGHFYGTSRAVLEKARQERRDLILDIDVQGARQLKERVPEAVSIFILPPSREILEARLRSRSEDAEEVIQRRLREAGEEIRRYRQYDYVLVNTDVNASVETLASIVRAERVRRSRMEQFIQPILQSFDSRY